MKASRRLALALIVADTLLFVFFFAVALFRQSATTVLPHFALNWELATAALDFFHWLPPLQFFVAIITLASFRGETEGIVAKVAIPAVIISVLLSASALILGPLLQKQIDSSLAISSRFAHAMGDLKSTLGANETEKARTAFDILEAIDAKDPRLEEFRKKLSNLEIRHEREAAKAALESQEKVDPAGGRAALFRARDFYAKGDWYNAHWQATLALRLDSTLLEAKRIAALAWEQISKASGETSQDSAEAAFYASKLRGYGLLRSEDYVGAWRVFAELSGKHGNDPEVRRYLKESLVGIENTAFFRDEADRAAVDSSLPRLFIRFKPDRIAELEKMSKNLASEQAGERILVAAGTAWVSGATYLFDLEYMERRPDGSALLLRSKWGKLTGGRLYLVAAERLTPGLSFRPTALELPVRDQATLGESTLASSGKETRAPASIEIGIGVDELMYLASARSSPYELQVLDAWNILARAPQFGIDPEPLILDLVRREGLPFAFFGSAALGVLLGLRLRVPTGQGKRLPIIALPFIAGLVFVLSTLAESLDGLASIWIARLLPDLRALGLAAGIRTIFFLAATFLVVSATREGLPSGDDLDS